MSSRRIEDLDISFQKLAQKFLDECNKETGPVKTFITDGFRSYAEQNDLYAQGRTKPGKIVTNARGGDSWHNHGLAIDCAFQLESGALSYADMYYKKIAPIAKVLGIDWGGLWTTFVDKPHFEWHPGITLPQAKTGKRPNPWSDTMDTMPTWVKGYFTEKGIDLDNEGDSRSKLGEIFDGAKKYVEAEKARAKAEKDLVEARADATRFEELHIQLSKENKRLSEELDALRRQVTDRDTIISGLQARVTALEAKLPPEGTVTISKDEYLGLKAKTATALKTGDLLLALFRKVFRKR